MTQEVKAGLDYGGGRIGRLFSKMFSRLFSG